MKNNKITNIKIDSKFVKDFAILLDLAESELYNLTKSISDEEEARDLRRRNAAVKRMDKLFLKLRK